MQFPVRFYFLVIYLLWHLYLQICMCHYGILFKYTNIYVLAFTLLVLLILTHKLILKHC